MNKSLITLIAAGSLLAGGVLAQQRNYRTDPLWGYPKQEARSIGIPPLPAPANSLPDAKYKITVPNPLSPKVITPQPFYAPYTPRIPEFTTLPLTKKMIEDIQRRPKEEFLIVYPNPNKYSKEKWEKMPTYGWGFSNLLDQAATFKMYKYEQVLKDGEPLIENGRKVYQRHTDPSYKPRSPARDSWWVEFFDPEF